MAKMVTKETACISDTGTEAKPVTGDKLLRNTIEKKRQMRIIRKKKKHNAIREAKETSNSAKRLCLAKDEVRLEQVKRVQAESDAKKYRGMARTYFDCICWEVGRYRREETL